VNTQSASRVTGQRVSQPTAGPALFAPYNIA
jgi:hypothetical protein